MGKANSKFKFQVHPWTDEMGQPLGDSLLKEKSKSWSAETWESYLDSADSTLHEKQVVPDHFDRLCNSSVENIFSHTQEFASAELFARLQNSISNLTEQQRSVIELLYFKSKSHREAARELLISQSRVRDVKQQALKKLRTDLQRGALTLPLMNKQKKENSNGQENFESDFDAAADA